MAEVSIFMNEDDLEQIIHELLIAGYVVYPDIPLLQCKAVQIDTLELFREYRSMHLARLFFAASSICNPIPFEFHSIDKNGDILFHIKQRTGGPTINVFAPLPASSGKNIDFIPHGFIGYHPTFWNPLSQQNENVPLALKKMYKRIIQMIDVEADHIQGKYRKYLIAKGAKSKLASGFKLGAPFDKE